MSIKEELEQMDVNVLAMYCQRLAEVSEANSMEADAARQLKQEWNLFIGSVHTQDEIKAQTEQLRERMLKFLSTVELPPFLVDQAVDRVCGIRIQVSEMAGAITIRNLDWQARTWERSIRGSRIAAHGLRLLDSEPGST